MTISSKMANEFDQILVIYGDYLPKWKAQVVP
jgi:hypothetical protein